MTGSYTSMLLAAILLTKINHIDELKDDVSILCNYGQKILELYQKDLKNISELPFERAVFLGSGPFLGCAEECHLKVQELTDGKVISKYDSFLGFRHGPKAVITPQTLIVYLFSPDPYVSQYERDLVDVVQSGERGMFNIGVFEKHIENINLDLNIILGSEKDDSIDSDLLPVCYVMVGQILGILKSLQLGLKPDNPSESGTITRVVQGVNIYPFEK